MSRVVHEGEVYRRVVADYMNAVHELNEKGYLRDTKWEDLRDLLQQMGWTVESTISLKRGDESITTDAEGNLNDSPWARGFVKGPLIEVVGMPPYTREGIADRLLAAMENPKIRKKQPKGDWSRSFSEPSPEYFGATAKPPADPEPGRIYVLSFGVTPAAHIDFDADHRRLLWNTDDSVLAEFKYGIGQQSARVTNAAGKAAVVRPGDRISRIVESLKKLKFKSAFKTWSKGSTKTRKPTVTQMRTMENTGTCAICDRNIKLTKGGLMWDHGYEVPWGMGGRTQGCFGVNWPPYEKSPKACEAYIGSLQKLLSSTEEKLAKADEVKKLPHPHKRGRQLEMIEPGNRFWDTAFKRYIGGLKRTTKMIPVEIERMQKKVDNWEPKPLPGER